MTAGPLTPHYFGTEAFDAKASGGAFKRLKKVETISQWEPAQNHLRVCFGFKSKERTENCSYCSKCIRTRMDLNILGRLKDFKTLRSPFSVLDYLRWGRWLEIGYGWEKNTWNHCVKHRPLLLPIVAIDVIIGYFRFGLKRILPGSLKKWIYKLISGPDPHIMHEFGRIQVNSNTHKDPLA